MFSRSALQLGKGLVGVFQRNSRRIAIAALPLFLFQFPQKFFAQQPEQTSSQTSVSDDGQDQQPQIVPHVENNGVMVLCRVSDVKEGNIKVIEVAGQKILLANVKGEIYACDAVSPVDNKTLLDSSLLIGDRIYDTVNGAIFSIKEGVTDYSPNLEQLRKHTVLVNNQVVSVRVSKDKPFFDTINMRGWVPEFTNLIILGSGLESLQISRTLRQAKYRGLITIMFGEDIEGPYDRNLLFEDLSNLDNPPVKDKTFYDQFQIKIAKNKEKVKYINIDEQIVKTAVGKEDPVPYQNLVYALGSRPRFHGIFGLGLQGIYQPSTIADFQQLKKDSTNFKKIVVVGDSLNSIRLANNLKKNTKADVTLVTEDDCLFKSLNLGEEVHKTVISNLEKNGIKVLTKIPVTGALGDQKVEKVVLQNGQELNCDSLFLMREEFPNVDSCESSMRLCDDGALYTDSYQRTVSQNIYTLGATASILAPFIGVRKVYPSSGDSLLQAHSTALNLIEKRLALRTIPFESIKLQGNQINVIGFTSTSTSHITHGDIAKNDYITYYFRGDQLVGAATPNKYRDLAIVREALYQDIVPRGQYEINTNDLLNKIQNLKFSKLESSFKASMQKRAHLVK